MMRKLMPTTLQRWILLGLSLAGSAVASASMLGCDQGCDVDATCVPEGWPGTSGLDDGCPADPADGPIRPDCGVWVSATRGQDTYSGAQVAPVQTLKEAISRAQAGTKRVYACGDTYAEQVKVPSGVSLFGGFDCENGWAYAGIARRAKISPASGNIALIFLDGDEQALVGDVDVRSADAESPGESSIAVLVQEQAKGSLRRAGLVAGHGADGADGDDGDHDGFPAKKGLSGHDGMDSCTGDPGFGGAVVKVTCMDGTFSTGGPGGDGGELVASNGADGLPVPSPNPVGYGLGGKGEAAAPMCTGGTNGVQGASGQDGLAEPVNATHRITNEGIIIGGDGGSGTLGLPGQGGGGGGASFGKAICGAAPHGGAGGGSGGTGGCGGRGGRGGQSGGSSIGLVVRGPDFTFYDVRVTANNGGNGGKGGQSQQGGQGGLPGGGGQGLGGAGGIQSGCGGGIGGNGGNGGYGAGGRGGDSVAVAMVGLVNVRLDGNSAMVPGDQGLGGEGGNPSALDQVGAPGAKAGNAIFDP